MSEGGIEARLWPDGGFAGVALPDGKTPDDALRLALRRRGEKVGELRTLRAWPDESTLTVRLLEVDLRHRRQGVGRAALRLVEETAYWWRLRRVCVDPRTAPEGAEAAMAFARACGYAPAAGTSGLLEKPIALEREGDARPARGAKVTLEPVQKDNARAVCTLRLGPGQERFVAPNALSVAQAQFEPTAWLRAVCADGVPVGLVLMMTDDDSGQPYLWRFMIDVRWQGFGFGRAAIDLALAHARTMPGARELLLSYVPAAGGPRSFYLGLGFEETGQMHEGELVMSKPLAP
jgi:diamine N-acetyltransferase